MGRDARIRHQRPSRSISAKAPAPIVNIAERRMLRDAMQPSRKQGIFVAVPSVDGRVNFSIALMFGRAMASSALAECPFNFTIHAEIGKRGIDYARNCIVKTFMEDSDADWLVMVDADQMVPDNFWQLCAVRDADVVSAVVPVWVANMDPETMLRVNNYGLDAEHRCYNLPTPPPENVQPYRVPIVGTGCIAIRRRVFAPKPRGVGLTPFFFTHLPDRKVQAGEDINFSVECQRAGFMLAVHPGVRVGHMKELELWQVEAYYNARHKMESEGRSTTEAQRLSIG